MRTRGILAGAGVAGAAAAFLVYRHWHQRWGATADEVHGLLPGDAVVPVPRFQATRAVTIDAPPEAVWPWLVQIGRGRAGFYAYDRLDNAGVPLNLFIHPDRILTCFFFAAVLASIGGIKPDEEIKKRGTRVACLEGIA